MKKLVLTLLLILPFGLVAQPPHQKGEKMTAEQHAILRAKAMRLHLDLTSTQEEKIKKAIQSQMESMKAHRKKAKSERLSKYDRKLHFLDSQLALKEQMKSILTNDQYEKWNSAHAQKRRMAMHLQRGRKGKINAMKNKRSHTKMW